MKKINPPDVNDIEELQKLAKNNNLGSHPKLLNEIVKFQCQYDKYIEHAGNPWNIDSIVTDQGFSKSLISHYNDTPKDRLLFIKDYRRTVSPTVCPMCGGFGNGTLDHYLPKSDYPEYAFFSKNLVPACNCNSLRKNAVKGAAVPARAIHPYFDTFLDQRLYTSVFEGSFQTPQISIKVIDENHPDFMIIQFHLDKVIDNDATKGWFDKYWVDLSLRAHDILDLVLPPQNITGIELQSAIQRYRNAKDKEYETLNNWYSIFYTGLINDQARLNTLADRINSSR